jgi:hypothetical protein
MGKEVVAMLTISVDSLILIPLGLAVTFMLWALWNFWRAAGRP